MWAKGALRRGKQEMKREEESGEILQKRRARQ
jgi:hypothetical protein